MFDDDGATHESLDIRGVGRALSSSAGDASGPADLVCLSHLRWNFVFQRPQHLMTRCAAGRRVFFVEEPVFGEGPARMEVHVGRGGVRIAVPHLSAGTSPDASVAMQANLLRGFLAEQGVDSYVLWFYTPMALAFARNLEPAAVVYDCMDELSHFAGAPPALRALEAELLERADLVFTGGQSLYEAKRDLHPRVHAFPSSVDVAHFAEARRPIGVGGTGEPPDQASLPHPRLGYFGVIDERMDLELLDGVAAARPSWQVVIVGPVAKVDPAALPRRPNIHYLGMKSYEELPRYLAGWDVALLPFAKNDATKFISPTKTPEYLAAGKQVVSTSIRDVVRPYGERGLVRIADGVPAFVEAVEACLREGAEHPRRAEIEALLAEMSWDRTWEQMGLLIDEFARRRVAERAGA